MFFFILFIRLVFNMCFQLFVSSCKRNLFYGNISSSDRKNFCDVPRQDVTHARNFDNHFSRTANNLRPFTRIGTGRLLCKSALPCPSAPLRAPPVPLPCPFCAPSAPLCPLRTVRARPCCPCPPSPSHPCVPRPLCLHVMCAMCVRHALRDVCVLAVPTVPTVPTVFSMLAMFVLPWSSWA